MRPSHTFTVSLPPELAEQVDRLAAAEHRTRSELFREAFRRYLATQDRWDRIFAYGEQAAKKSGLRNAAAADDAVDLAVREVRRRRTERRS